MFRRKILVISVLITSLLFLSGLTNAADRQVNISGATLFENFFTAPASTNDFIDVDGDGVFGFDPINPPFVDQLATTYSTSGWSPYWKVQYRGVGSGNGLKEMVTWYDHPPDPCEGFGIPADLGIINRVAYAIDGALIIPPAVPGNPGGSPVPQDQIDIAVMDVPTTWFVVAGDVANAKWSNTPTSDGYGGNPVCSWDIPDRKNTLKSLGGLNLNVSSPDDKTVFDTNIAWVPISFIANAGVSADPCYTQRELQHLFVTGRKSSGENLVAATRDSGSGTRNGAMNSMGIDPSWGRGDNLADKLSDEGNENYTYLGPGHQATNCGGSSRIESAVQNRRLAVGYTGLAGSSRAAKDAASGKYEIINVQKNEAGGWVRPSLDSVLDNADINTGWQIGGLETFASVGDPYDDPASPVAPMRNSDAADYIKNITESIASFVSSTGQDPDKNMPGEFLAFNFFLVASVDAMPDPLDPDAFSANPILNQNLQDFVKNLTIPPIDVFPFNSQANGTGKVPVRKALTGGESYSDGSVDGSYTDAGGNVVTSGMTLAERNKIMGDFNYAGAEKHRRNINDTAQLVAAVLDPNNFEKNVNHGGSAGDQSGDYMIVQVIGDFNGDGNFDVDDVRYFADGLAVDPFSGLLDRAAAFVAVDSAAATGNFFGTTLAASLGRAYQADSGWSKADIAGSGQITAGAAPAGADGVIDDMDIDYLHKVLRGGLRAAAYGEILPINPFVHDEVLDWTDIDQAVFMDLSCDLNGDLIVSQDDVNELLINVLGTSLQDVNLDGIGNDTDRQIIVSHLDRTTTGRGWSEGDIDGDGYVTELDLMLFDNLCLEEDINCDGHVDMLDFQRLSESWLIQ